MYLSKFIPWNLVGRLKIWTIQQRLYQSKEKSTYTVVLWIKPYFEV